MDLKRGNFKKNFKKFWFLVWEDDSFRGWLFSLIFLFILIKFIFFPFLNLVTGTTLPLAIVESCSMYHEYNIFSNFDNWIDRHNTKYQEVNITSNQFKNFVLKGGVDKGDIIFIIKANPEKLKIGDIIAFNSGTRGTPVIHRIINIQEKGNEKIFTTMGDNNAKTLTPSNNAGGIDEREIKENQIVGKAVFRIVPWVGWVKLIFFENFRAESEKGFCNEN